MIRPILQEVLAKVDGALCVSLMATDGIPIEEVRAPGASEINADLVCAEYAGLQKRLAKMNEGMELPGFKELVVSTAPLTVMLCMVSDEYFLVLLMLPRLVGRARYELRKAQLLLHREIS